MIGPAGAQHARPNKLTGLGSGQFARRPIRGAQYGRPAGFIIAAHHYGARRGLAPSWCAPGGCCGRRPHTGDAGGGVAWAVRARRGGRRWWRRRRMTQLAAAADRVGPHRVGGRRAGGCQATAAAPWAVRVGVPAPLARATRAHTRDSLACHPKVGGLAGDNNERGARELQAPPTASNGSAATTTTMPAGKAIKGRPCRRRPRFVIVRPPRNAHSLCLIGGATSPASESPPPPA
jgi:hypothetical protein